MLTISFSVLFSVTALAVLAFLFCKPAQRWVVLLLASLLFYFLLTGLQVLMLFAFAAIVYAGTLQIDEAGNDIKRRKKISYWFAGFSLVPLLVLKLLPFLSAELLALLPKIPIEHKAYKSQLLEITGISYFTFNGISYLIDVHKKYIKPSRNYFFVLLYISFFPIILAGPMHRAKNLFDQFRYGLSLSNQNFSEGFRRILWGLFKNFVIAQQCKFFMDTIERNNAGGWYVLLQGLAFFFYLYFNFSSYIDIFSGIARIFNIELVKNFNNRVYASSSRKQFWEGWHITLNHWFRDYFFFPLAKGIKSKWAFNLALLFTFVLIGIWHGISWRFAIWGIANGAWIILEQKWKPAFNFIPDAVRKHAGMLYHMSVASFIALLFSTNNPLQTYKRLFSATQINEGINQMLLFHLGLILLFFIPFDLISRKAGNETFEVYLGKQPLWVRWPAYVILSVCILSFTVNWAINSYYFRF
ncbi:MAG: MBOAT family O-acyltransferase [Lacibacter sp.]